MHGKEQCLACRALGFRVPGHKQMCLLKEGRSSADLAVPPLPLNTRTSTYIQMSFPWLALQLTLACAIISLTVVFVSYNPQQKPRLDLYRAQVRRAESKASYLQGVHFVQEDEHACVRAQESAAKVCDTGFQPNFRTLSCICKELFPQLHAESFSDTRSRSCLRPALFNQCLVDALGQPKS